jgi:hypothetical protein
MIAGLIALVAIVFYAYTIQGDIKVSPPKGGCNACPKQQAFQNV